MRIIEPKVVNKDPQLPSDEVPTLRPGKKRFSKKLLVLLVVVAVAIVIALLFKAKVLAPDGPQKSALNSTQTTVDTTPAPKTKLRTFTPEQFQQLYESISYPNTRAITEEIPITGNQAADARMRSIASSRGYRLRSIPVSPIQKIGDPNLTQDDLLQQKALDAWRELQAAAQKDGLPLRILSGYRSPELQRSIFMSRFRATGGSAEAAANAQADGIINSVLVTSSLPGYSRHHTGYTIDLQCNNGTLEAFEGSPCFTWISKNNYENAKKTGWIPSYPAGADKQGPEPEPWEYVWVGKDAVME